MLGTMLSGIFQKKLHTHVAIMFPLFGLNKKKQRSATVICFSDDSPEAFRILIDTLTHTENILDPQHDLQVGQL
jgi:hypothetical protein